MNRFYLLLLLAFPLTAWCAPQNWKPVALAKILPNKTRLPAEFPVEDLPDENYVAAASGRYVFVGQFLAKIYDLKTGKQRDFNLSDYHKGASFGGGSGPYYLGVYPDGGPEFFKLPLPKDIAKDTSRFHFDLSLSKARNCVELFTSSAFCRWNIATRQLTARAPLALPPDEATLSSDGQTIVVAQAHNIALISTRTGKVVRRVPLVGVEVDPSSIKLSPFGGRALYLLTSLPGSDRVLHRQVVVDTRTGRRVWSFDQEKWDDRLVFSPDDKFIALPLFKRKVWEIRDLATGQLAHMLPLLPGVTTGAFSPDGATLYSVSNGVLYRQRAR